MVLGKCHRIHILSVNKAHERELRTCKELLNYNLAFAELVVKKHILEGSIRLFQGLRNHNALSRSKSVIFQYHREGTLLYIFKRRFIILKSLECGSRDIVLCHELLGEILARLDCSSRL